jgi:hypothetical protein
MSQYKIRSFWIGMFLVVALCGSASAEPVWICSITEGVETWDDGTCHPPNFGGLAMPTFLKVDLNRKQITLMAPESRRGEITEIGVFQKGDGKWVIAGIEEGRAWSMVISDAGHMTLSVSGDGTTWSAFGHTMPAD